MTAGRTPGGNPQRIARLFEKLPPHAIEAEMCLLGSILLEPRELGDITLIIRDGEDFYKPANGAIYDAMVELHDIEGRVGVVQLDHGVVDGAVGGLVEVLAVSDDQRDVA